MKDTARHIVTHRWSRRTFLGSLAGSAMGLAWFSAAPALAQAISATGAMYTQGQTLYSYKGQSAAVETVDWSPGGSRIVSAGSSSVTGGSSAVIWDALTGDHVITFASDGRFVYSARWSPDGTRIASGTSQDATIWDMASGLPLVTYTGHPIPSIGPVKWSPDGARCASASLTAKDTNADDDAVHVWDAQTGTHLLTYSGHTNVVTGLAWSPNSNYIASGSFGSGLTPDNTVQIWDSRTGARLLTYQGHTQGVAAVAWSPDGERIASASADKTVQIWNPFTGKTYLTYRGHTAEVYCVGWSPDGTLVASGGWDNSVQLWSPISPKTLFYYYGNGADGYVFDVDWSPDGRLIVDGTFPILTSTQAQALVWVAR